MSEQINPMIHKYCQNGTYMLLDVNSGIINVIDKVTYDILDIYDGTNKDAVYEALGTTYSQRELDESLAELDELIGKEMLFAPMCDNFKVVAEEEPVIKSLCLNIAHDCNLRCKYCFASQGDYDTHKRELMSFDVAKRAVDLLIRSTEGKRQHCEIDFFGGEPLMNFDVVKQTIEYIREQEKIHNKIFKLSLTTNGMLLDPAKVKYLTDQHISLILSLDGRPEVHNRMRPDAGGRDSYDTCARNQVYAAKHRNGEEYYVRGTYTKYNLDFTEDVRHMADLGFEGLSMEPVVGDDLSYAITDDDLPRIFDEYDRLTDFYLQRYDEGRPFIYYHFIMDLYRGPCIAKRLRGCGAGHEYMCVVPNGDIYPCHQFVGQDGYVIGNVYEGVTNDTLPALFRDMHVLNKPECCKCWAKFFCSGGCHANNIKYGGNIQTPYELSCRIQKKRIECAMYIQAKLAMKRQEAAQE
ncbi:thioether cross-link-forming SCIFF peptide maturase [uncultured Megasphaera sp.]|jgi:uncharacterized protein|uniref:thioether cross-link-forming SCIFF peptide maturase n=1 Tax=uncultured Megasphaera sp. TaxID=165188 RepID=UPI0025E2A4C2|nr:thioether cross-link-forming SCIFF peptide maturase [uncultured Megasphaera sp.]